MGFLKNLDYTTLFAGRTSKIYNLSPTHVLRVRSLESIANNIGHQLSKGGEKDFFKHQVKLANETFKILRNKYRIGVPHFEFSLEQHQNVWWLINVEEKINGESLFTIEMSDKVPFDDIYQLVSNYGRYIRDVYDNNNTGLWNDFKTSQFMYGTKQNNPNTIYLVDLDPIVFENITKPLIDDAIYRLKSFIETLVHDYNLQDIARLRKTISSLPSLDKGYSALERHPIKEGVF